VIPLPMIIGAEIDIPELPGQRHPFPTAKARHPAETFPIMVITFIALFLKRINCFKRTYSRLLDREGRRSRTRRMGRREDHLPSTAARVNFRGD
jgi:hypothetical protein